MRPLPEVGLIRRIFHRPGRGRRVLTASVQAGESGPVIVLAGEADLTCGRRVDALIAAQLAGETQQLTIDVSGLRFADVASARTLALAAKRLTDRGGRLVVLDPQPPVTRVLALLGMDQILMVRRTARSLAPLDANGQRDGQRGPAPGRTRKARDEHGTD